MRADSRFDLLGCTDDLATRLNVAGLALAHQASPTACDQGAWPGAGDAGGGVYAARPVGGDEVLV